MSIVLLDLHGFLFDSNIVPKLRCGGNFFFELLNCIQIVNDKIFYMYIDSDWKCFNYISKNTFVIYIV